MYMSYFCHFYTILKDMNKLDIEDDKSFIVSDSIQFWRVEIILI